MDKCKRHGKDVLPSKGAAIRAALNYSKRRGVALRYYWEPTCRGYHLTKQPKRDNDSERKSA